MPFYLVYAQRADATDSNLVFAFIVLAIIVGVGIVAMLPVVISRRHAHRQLEAIIALMVLWGAFAAGSLIYTVRAQFEWERENTMQLESGLYDPKNAIAPPKWPWALWVGMAVGYAGAMVWGRTTNMPSTSQGFEVRRKE